MSISRQMRDVLIDHMDDRAVPIAEPMDAVDGLEAWSRRSRRGTIQALVRAGLLRERSRHTFITDAGRCTLAAALADWADAIVRLRGKDALPPLPPTPRQTAERDFPATL